VVVFEFWKKFNVFRSFLFYAIMLWSQIKLTPHDFSVSRVDNHPGTVRFLWIFSCVVTYRTGAGRRLYMITSADAGRSPYGIVRCPAVVVRDVYINIKNRHYSTKQQIVKTRNTEADDDSGGGENHTYSLCSWMLTVNSTCLIHVSHPQLLKRNMYFVIIFWS